MSNPLAKQLEETGIVVIPELLNAEQLQCMQMSFDNRLKRLRWNNFDGYEKTERFRHMVQDVLTIDQGFVDVALHPTVKAVLREYLGDTFELVEAKGWKSLPTKSDFHGWHGDAWYNQRTVRDRIPREVKCGLYLSDVTSGAFVYIKGTHGKEAPRGFSHEDIRNCTAESFCEVTGRAGMAFLFDTSGIHRQQMPILEPRRAVFFNYHDPQISLQAEDVDYYRYHPLMLNAAFLGNLTEEDRRILGFGNKVNFQSSFERKPSHVGFQSLMHRTYDAKLHVEDFCRRAVGKLKHLLT